MNHLQLKNYSDHTPQRYKTRDLQPSVSVWRRKIKPNKQEIEYINQKYSPRHDHKRRKTPDICD